MRDQSKRHLQQNSVQRVQWEAMQALEPRVLMTAVSAAHPDSDAVIIEKASLGDDAASSRWILSLDGVHGVSQSVTQRLANRFGVRISEVAEQPGLFSVEAYSGVAASTVERVLKRLPGFNFVEADATLSVDTTIFSDPGFGVLWGLNNTGQNGGKIDADIDAPEAWDLTTGSSEVVVAVIDTGVNWSHPDLAANIWTHPGEVAGDGLDNDGNGYVDDIRGWDFVNNDNNPADDQGHGTHVAGTIAAVGNNAQGIVGVAPGVKILPLKFMDASGSGATSNAVRALSYVKTLKQRGIDVLVTNNSWGGGGYSQALYDAIAAQRDNGILFVAAAGNDAANNDAVGSFPANYNLDNVVSVASTDRYDNRSSFSNYGATTVDMAAPGTDIVSAWYGGGYAYMSGTSMATPHVAGAAALAWSYRPDATYREVRGALIEGGDSLGSLAGITASGKRLNVAGTLELLREPEIVVTPPSISSFAASAATVTAGDPFTLTAQAQAGAPNAVSRVEFYRDADGNGALNSAVDALLAADVTPADGFTTSQTSEGLPHGDNAFFARAQDTSGLWSDAAAATVFVNPAPVLGSLTGTPASGPVGTQWKLSAVDVADPLGAVAAVEFSLDRNGNGLVDATETLLGADTSAADGFTLTHDTTGMAVGSYRLLARARDDRGAYSAAKGVTLQLTGAPSLAGLSVNPTLIQVGNAVTLTANGAADPDGSVVAVEFYRDTNRNGVLDIGTDTLLATDTSATGGWSAGVSSSSFPTGAITFFARARDNTGLHGAPVLATATVNAPPVVGSFAIPSAVAQGVAVTLSALSVTDADGVVRAVEFYRDTNANNRIDVGTDVFIATDTDATGGWTATMSTTGLALGRYTLLTRAQDDGGAWSATKTRTLTVTAAPTLAGVTATPDPVAKGANVTLTASGAADADGAVVAVNFYRDSNGNGVYDTADALIGTDASSTGGWSYVAGTGTWAAGTHRIFARAKDNLGVYGPAVTNTLRVNALATVGGLSANPSTPRFGETLRLTATQVADADGTVSRVEFFRDTNGDGLLDAGVDLSLGADSYGADGWSINSPTSGFSAGTNTFFARAIDNLGHAGTARKLTLTIVA